MKLVSSLALGAALVLGGATVAAAAKEKPAAAPAPYAYKLGKAFRAAVGPAQAALKAGDMAGAETAVTAAEAAAVDPDEKFVAAQLRLDLAGKLKNSAMQAKAVDAMLASGSGAAGPDLPRLNFYAGSFAYNAGNYARAIQMLTEAQRLGFKSTDASLLLAEANFKTNNIPAGLGQVEQAIAASNAAGTKAPEAWYARAASVAYKAKLMGESAKWTRAQVRAYPTTENWRSALVIYRDSGQREGQLNLDIFRLMRITKSLAGERDYYELASLAAERGLPGEAKSVIEEGTAINAFPPSSRAIADLRAMVTAKIPGDQASLAAAEKQAGSSATGKVAAATADAYLGYGQDAKALALYKTALAKGGVDTDAVNTRMGIALTRLGQKAEAKAAFAAVKGPRADIAAFWTLWLDQQG
jgi:tetratricopeptide (TPR) repeat protein